MLGQGFGGDVVQEAPAAGEAAVAAVPSSCNPVLGWAGRPPGSRSRLAGGLALTERSYRGRGNGQVGWGQSIVHVGQVELAELLAGVGQVRSIEHSHDLHG